ncbi:MAG TPA: flagellar biosynthesis regulator FlaF [Syntrophorhabdus sp.]|jgi:flagellar protein FlaF|nr:flagellar biosynthesis regulator FlaF [Syntrophorhabdus sp.]
MMQTVRNPYDVYKKAEEKSLAGKDLEVAVLVKGARLLKECQRKWETYTQKQLLMELAEACKYNQRIWAIFQTEALQEDNPMPIQLKRNIILLAGYIDKRLLDVLAYPNPKKLTQIIDININIAAGLRGIPEGELPFDLD